MDEQRAEHDPVVAELEAAIAARRSGLAPSTIREAIRRVGTLLGQEEAKLVPITGVSAITPSSFGEETAAIAFWRKVIDRYTGGVYMELDWDDARFRGIVQRFSVAS